MKRIMLVLTLAVCLSSATTVKALLPAGTTAQVCNDSGKDCTDDATSALLAPGVVQNRAGGTNTNTGGLMVSLILAIYGI